MENVDLKIAQEAKMEKIVDIAAKLGLNEEDLELYGNYKAKIDLGIMKKLENKENGKVILVTAINPTPAGEGKSTTTVGLGQAFTKIGENAIIALREPSFGPVMGVKGGAAGGGGLMGLFLLGCLCLPRTLPSVNVFIIRAEQS